jgi:archaeal type IV pilus assembly protein PilA
MIRPKQDEAVSPVIGVILMVAITVILAAVIAAFVFGMAGGISKTKSVAVTARQIGSNFAVVYQGGQDDASVGNMTVQFLDNGTVFYYDSATAGTHLSTSSAAADKPAVGSSATSSGASSSQDHIVVTIQFLDGTQQVILDTYV